LSSRGSPNYVLFSSRVRIKVRFSFVGYWLCTHIDITFRCYCHYPEQNIVATVFAEHSVHHLDGRPLQRVPAVRVQICRTLEILIATGREQNW